MVSGTFFTTTTCSIMRVRTGGPAPTLCAWFWLGRLAPMAGKRFAVFMRSYVHILCAIGRADRVSADQCVQLRLACSVGDSPTGGIVRTPVA